MATIRKRGDRYHVQVRRKGFAPRTASFSTKREAAAWGRMVEAGIDIGLPDARESLRSVSVRDLLKRYRDEVSPYKRGGTKESYRLKLLEEDSLASLSLARLSPRFMADFRDRKLSAGLSPSTVSRDLSLFSAVFTHARREWEYPFSNPVSDIRKPRPAPGRERRLMQGEEEALYRACQDLPGTAWMEQVIRIALATAMRRGEILALRWDDVDTERAVARLRMTKNGSSRLVPLSPAALAVLEGLPRVDERVFPYSGNRVNLAWQRVRLRAGLAGKDLHFHDLRHEAASRLAERGDLELLEVAAVTGHKDLRMLQRYTHLSAMRIAQKLAASPS